MHAGPICLVILAAFRYWFAVADRYAIFLYEHLGATAFDEVTSSFAFDIRLQLTAFLVAAIVAAGITALRRRLPSTAHRSTI